MSPHLRYPPCLPWHPEQEVEVVHENLKNPPCQAQPLRIFFSFQQSVFFDVPPQTQSTKRGGEGWRWSQCCGQVCFDVTSGSAQWFVTCMTGQPGI